MPWTLGRTRPGLPDDYWNAVDAAWGARATATSYRTARMAWASRVDRIPGDGSTLFAQEIIRRGGQ